MKCTWFLVKSQPITNKTLILQSQLDFLLQTALRQISSGKKKCSRHKREICFTKFRGFKENCNRKSLQKYQSIETAVKLFKAYLKVKELPENFEVSASTLMIKSQGSMQKWDKIMEKKLRVILIELIKIWINYLLKTILFVFIITVNNLFDWKMILNTPQPLYNTIVGVHSINRVS